MLYTSDGRDVEMSVASTKAFYAQVAAGVAAGLRDQRGGRRRHAPSAATSCSTALRELPDAMREVLARRAVDRRGGPPLRADRSATGPSSAAAPTRSPPRRCGSSSASSATSRSPATSPRTRSTSTCRREPLILVCAAGLAGSTADDVAKEVAIFRAHKATPIVVADDGDDALRRRRPSIAVPPVDPALGFVLSAMVGHLFGYEAALAIDALGAPAARGTRGRSSGPSPTGIASDECSPTVRAGSPPTVERYVDGLRAGRYDGHLEASTAVRLAGLLRDVHVGPPGRGVPGESGKVGSPGGARRRPRAALTRAIEELTRPVDAIKHQAKTVTVGISRSDEGVMDRALVQAVLDAGAGRDVLTYRTLKVLADLDPAVAEVVGFTRYGIEGDSDHASSTAAGSPTQIAEPRRPQPAARRHQAPRRQPSARCSSPGAAATAAR